MLVHYRADPALHRIPLDAVGEAPFSGRRHWLIVLEFTEGRLEAVEDQLKSLSKRHGGQQIDDYAKIFHHRSF